jgi:predicted metal-binding membrane protein
MAAARGEYGLHCLGRCWPLMVLTGAMSLVWMIGVSCFVLAEMHVPRLRGLTRLAGIALVGSACRSRCSLEHALSRILIWVLRRVVHASWERDYEPA